MHGASSPTYLHLPLSHSSSRAARDISSREDHYIYEESKPRLESIVHIMEHHDEVMSMFREADEAMKSLEQEGKSREAAIASGEYSRAERAWAECDYDMTCVNLQNVIARVPERAIASILILILLPAFAPAEPRPRARAQRRVDTS